MHAVEMLKYERIFQKMLTLRLYLHSAQSFSKLENLNLVSIRNIMNKDMIHEDDYVKRWY